MLTKKLLQIKESMNNSFAVAFVFKNWHCVLPEGGTHVPIHDG